MQHCFRFYIRGIYNTEPNLVEELLSPTQYATDPSKMRETLVGYRTTENRKDLEFDKMSLILSSNDGNIKQL